MNLEKQSTNLQMTLREVNRVGEVKKNIPKLRFKGYEDAWEQRKFGDIGTVVMCKRIFKEETSENGDVPFYKIGTFGGEPDAYITRELFEKYKSMYPYPQKGDILISASGSIGRTVEYTGKDEYFQDSNIVWLQHNKNINNSFLKVLYSVVQWSFEGSTIKRLYNDNFLKTKIVIPNIKEQSLIGEYFESLDNLITLHQRKYDALKSMKKILLSKMFPKNGEDVPEIRFKEFTDAWEQRKFGEISQRVQGNDGRMNLPTLTISAAYGWMDQIDRFSGNIAGTEQKNYTLLKKGELSYNHGNSKLAKYGAVFELSTYEEALVPKVYHSFRMIKGDSKFIEFLFATKLPDRELSKLISSGARMDGLLNITYSDFATINLTVPSEAEQNMVSNCLKALDDLLTLHQRKLEELKNMKKTLLQQMFV